jgi:acyl-CoA synthetase (AMP-forming)/AMP-acid ligase II
VGSDVRAAPYRTLIDPLVARATTEPDRTVLTLLREDGTDEALSAGDLHRAAQARSGGFAHHGVGVDDVVVLAIGSLRPLIETFFGALYCGAVPTISSLASDRLSPTVQRERLAALVRSCDARAVVGGPAQSDLLRTLERDVPAVLCCDELDDAGNDASEAAHRSPDDLAFLQFSSGSAGAQKGIPHTHGCVLRYLESKREAGVDGPAGLQSDDVIVSWLPLYHDLGLVSGVLAPLVLGLRAVLISPLHWVRDPGVLLRAIYTYRGTACYMPNFALNHCARAVRDRDIAGVELTSLRQVVIGAEPVQTESLRLFAERFRPYGLPDSALRAGYGMAEMVEGVTVTPRGRPPRVDWVERASLEKAHRATPAGGPGDGSVAVVSCGPPMAGAEVRIVSDSGAALPDRTVGEILIRAEFMFGGYYRAPELTARSFCDGWFQSGDLGYLVDGELYVTGRKTDRIIFGGRNLHPEELERIADATPGLAPGRSVAFGLPDPALGWDRIVMVCEAIAAADADQQLSVERTLRREVMQQIGVALGDVRVVERGWVVKTSSGKLARPENRRKYLERWKPVDGNGAAR